MEGDEVTNGHRMSPSWFQPPGRAGFVVNSRWKLPKESLVLGFEVYNGKLRPPAGSELLPRGAYTLPEPMPVLQLLPDCFFGVSAKLRLSPLAWFWIQISLCSSS